MRILQVTPTYLPATRYGGPIFSVHALCAALVRHGHEVAVVTTNVDGPGISAVPVGQCIERDGVSVTYFETGHGRRLYRSPAMAQALAALAPSHDVIHVHAVFLWPTLAAVRAARNARLPIVISPRGMLVGDLIRRKSRLAKSAWINIVERRNLSHASLLHFTSQIERDEYDHLGLPARPSVVIPNGVELSSFAAAQRQTGSPPVILFLGRINWKKGLDLLIPAMVHVPDARLVIAGNDEEGLSAQLQSLAREANVAHRIQFVGEVDKTEKDRLLALANVLVLPSYSENFGNAVLEGMAAGVPVVVTPQVGLAPAVEQAGAGIVVPGNPEALGHALAALLADPEKQKQMGDRGRRAAVERFSWYSVAAAMSASYEQLIANRAVA